MAKLTSVREALHALRWNLPRGELPRAAQLEGDRLKPDRKWQAAMGRRAGVRAAWRVVPSARWYRFALVTIILGMLTGFTELSQQPSSFFTSTVSQPLRITRRPKTPSCWPPSVY